MIHLKCAVHNRSKEQVSAFLTKFYALNVRGYDLFVSDRISGKPTNSRAFYHSVIVPCISSFTGKSIAEVHADLKQQYLDIETMTKQGQVITLPGTTAVFNNTEHWAFNYDVINYYSEKGCYFPSPGQTNDEFKIATEISKIFYNK